jgi:hypothetical protein
MVVHNVAAALTLISRAKDHFAGKTGLGYDALNVIPELEAAARFFKDHTVIDKILPSGRTRRVYAPGFDEAARLLTEAVKVFVEGDRLSAIAKLKEAERAALTEPDLSLR